MRTVLRNIETCAPRDHGLHSAAIVSSSDSNAPRNDSNSRKAFILSSQRGSELLRGKRIMKRSV